MALKLWDSIDEVIVLAMNVTDSAFSYDSSEDSSSNATFNGATNVVRAVRKNFAVDLQDLIENGLYIEQKMSLVKRFLTCQLLTRSVNTPMHAWELILKFYEMEDGDSYTSSSACSSSRSFTRDLYREIATDKQRLLRTINDIDISHTKYERSYDSYFKAFVSEALNEQCLSRWLRFILGNRLLVDTYYKSWSIIRRRGLDDVFEKLDLLNAIDFNLPADLAIKPYLSMTGAL